MSGLLGLSVRAEAVLKNPDRLEKVREHKQVIFVWTDQLNDKETVQHLKKLGVNGVIYDRQSGDSRGQKPERTEGTTPTQIPDF